MSGRVTLPLVGSGDHESARRRLGGRARSAAGTGRLVRVARGSDPARVGVVLFVEPGAWHVWLGGGRVLKTAQVEPMASLEHPAFAELERVACQARHFAEIEEGARVEVCAKGGRPTSGTVQEKCRYGALVLDDGGQLLAVGFARIRQKKGTTGAAN